MKSSVSSGILHGLIFIAIFIIGVVAYHSVGEIHYLKSFFPKSFTVEEAMHASVIELIKVMLVGIPLFLFGVWCYVLQAKRV